MTLEQNIIDNILECEVKIGHNSVQFTVYYPNDSLCELLDCDEDNVIDALSTFKSNVRDTLGDVVLATAQDGSGRVGITIPASGVDWVSSNYKPSDFSVAFISMIKSFEATEENIISLFNSFDSNVVIERENEAEFAIYFSNESIDPYVYFIEQNDFGFEYHRYTREAYKRAMHNHN